MSRIAASPGDDVRERMRVGVSPRTPLLTRVNSACRVLALGVASRYSLSGHRCCVRRTPRRRPPHYTCGPSIGDAFFISGLISATCPAAFHRAPDFPHTVHAIPDTPMSARTTITRSKRLAGIRRLAARPRPGAAGAGVCVDAWGVGTRGIDRLRLSVNDASRDRGGEFGRVQVEMQHDAHIRITSFGAAVSLGGSPG